MGSKPILIRKYPKQDGRYMVHVRTEGHVVPVERLIDGALTYGRLNAEPATFTYSEAETVAHRIGRYKLGLGDFIDTYVDGLKEED